MADITETGATGRKPRGSGTTTPPAAEPTVPVAAVGTAETAAQAPSEPVVLGAGPVPETPGGPGVGAAQTARPVEGVETRPLTDVAAVDLGLRPARSADALSIGGRAELERLRLARGTSGFMVDAAEVPGRRMARAMTAIKRDGVLYAPDGDNPYVPVDFRAYTELVEIGAISDTPWGRLDDEHGDGVNVDI